MDYSDINSKWKQFLAENTFKEDILINKDKKKKTKKKDRKDDKEIIVSEEDSVSEWEEFQEAVLNEPSGTDGNNAVNSVEEEESLEEMSAVSGGAISFGAGNAFLPKKKVRHS